MYDKNRHDDAHSASDSPIALVNIFFLHFLNEKKKRARHKKKS